VDNSRDTSRGSQGRRDSYAARRWRLSFLWRSASRRRAASRNIPWQGASLGPTPSTHGLVDNAPAWRLGHRHCSSSFTYRRKHGSMVRSSQDETCCRDNEEITSAGQARQVRYHGFNPVLYGTCLTGVSAPPSSSARPQRWRLRERRLDLPPGSSPAPANECPSQNARLCLARSCRVPGGIGHRPDTVGQHGPPNTSVPRPGCAVPPCRGSPRLPLGAHVLIQSRTPCAPKSSVAVTASRSARVVKTICSRSRRTRASGPGRKERKTVAPS